MNWKHRIVELVEVPPEDLTAHPGNAKFHSNRQRNVMRAVLDEIGWIAPVIENITTGHLVDGHCRVEEALSAGVRRIPVIRVKLTEEEEAEALVTFDGVGQLARWEKDRLDDLIADINPDSAVLDELLQDLAKTAISLDVEPAPEPDPDDTMAPEIRSLCAVYPREQYREVVERLRSVPGDTVAAKLYWLLDRHVRYD